MNPSREIWLEKGVRYWATRFLRTTRIHAGRHGSLTAVAAERGGNNLKGFEEVRTENGSSRGLDWLILQVRSIAALTMRIGSALLHWQTLALPLSSE